LFEYTVVDIETTGLSKYIHKITEIAAQKFNSRGELLGEFQTLINPQERIPSFITRLTGIDNDLVKDSPIIEQVLPELLAFLEDSIIVAHNASFDYGFLAYNAEKLGFNFNNKKLCTRKLANRILPDLPRKKLGSICEYFNIVNEQAHRAMGDVRATAKIFDKFKEELKNNNIKTSEELLRFECSPRANIILK